jgi:hypothetical protein
MVYIWKLLKVHPKFSKMARSVQGIPFLHTPLPLRSVHMVLVKVIDFQFDVIENFQQSLSPALTKASMDLCQFKHA